MRNVPLFALLLGACAVAEPVEDGTVALAFCPAGSEAAPGIEYLEIHPELVALAEQASPLEAPADERATIGSDACDCVDDRCLADWIAAHVGCGVCMHVWCGGTSHGACVPCPVASEGLVEPCLLPPAHSHSQ